MKQSIWVSDIPKDSKIEKLIRQYANSSDKEDLEYQLMNLEQIEKIRSK